MQSPWGRLSLSRWPLRQRDPLRAWDAADELILSHLAESASLTSDSSPLVFNDGFGALATALADFKPLAVSDSWTGQQATKHNLKANGLPLESVQLLDSLQDLPFETGTKILKIPKSHALLEHQLHCLRSRMKPGETLLAGAMAKHIHSSTLALFERIIGPTRTSLAKKKARLVFAEFDPELVVSDNPYPHHYELPEYGLQVSNHANVFSREKLDIGTRFFLEHLPDPSDAQQVIDLGCGNGLLGVAMLKKHAQLGMMFVDESYMAIASARANAAQLEVDEQQLKFRVGYCLDGVETRSADLILNNPPFHQQHSVGDQVAWDMFRQSLGVLRTGGELYVVGNRHLGYHIKLKRLFGNCQTVASNQKFVILKARKNRGARND